MTPQEKAIELLEKLIPNVYNEYDGDGSFKAKYHAIQCAIICVDYILNTIEVPGSSYSYWQNVKQELKKL